MKKLTFFHLALLLTNLSFGQNLQNANWCFGVHARVDFNSNPPATSSCSITFNTVSYDAASVCDNNGQVLFYTNGTTVWGKDHNPMPNGNMLYCGSGSYYSGQEITIVPKPHHPGLYYIFYGSSNTVIPPGGHEGIYYSVVDMSLNNCNGDIVNGLKNIPLLNNDIPSVPIDYDYSTGLGLKVENVKLTTTMEASNDKIWMVFFVRFHDNTTPQRFVYSYLVSQNGINNTADGTSPAPNGSTQVSNSNYPGPVSSDYIGHIKISPDGTKLCDGAAPAVNLYNFDKQTGLVTFNNQVYTGIPGIISNPGYGVEFSSNNLFLYFIVVYQIIYQEKNGTEPSYTKFLYYYQRQLASDSNVLIAKYKISNSSGGGGGGDVPVPISNEWSAGLQRAIDGDIYTCTQDPFAANPYKLGAIENSNYAYPTCFFTPYKITLAPNTNDLGHLPQWVYKVSTADACQPSTGPWVWMHGDNTVLQPSIYGNQGVPHSANKPGYRTGSATWTDNSGNLWLFGGDRSYFDGNGVQWNEQFNDLWMYNATTNQWTWVNGDNIPNQTGIYGTQGVPSIFNKPGARAFATSWVDNNGNLWMFGGRHSNGTPIQGSSFFSDLWKYDIAFNQWTWVKGDNIENQSGIYGTQTQADPLNKPGARNYGRSWKSISGNLWLWGGNGVTDNFAHHYNDLWKYDINTNQWTWMKGSNIYYPSPLPLGDFGVQGVEASSNLPSPRANPGVNWVDINGYLWMFGGLISSYSGTPSYGFGNDAWRYNINTNNWTWMKGDDIPNQLPIYGTKGVASLNNNPGGRSDMVSWADTNGDLWLQGGNSSIVLSDFWKYSVSTNMWTWVGGTAYPFSSNAIYGTQGVGSSVTYPGQRVQSVSWTGNNGNFWLFGGKSNDFRNDLWKYTGNCTGPNCRPENFKRSESIVSENLQKESISLQTKREEKINISGISLMEIYNSAGQLIKTVNNNVQYYEILNASKISGIFPGLYFIRVVKKDNTFKTLTKYLQ